MEQRIVTKPSFYTNIMLLSIPIILQQFLRVSVDLCDSIMLGRIDQVQMAAVSQAQQIFFVFYTVCNGFAVGCSVLIAQYWGLQRKEEIKTLFAIGSKIIAVFAIIISAIVLIRPDQVMRIYSSDPEVIALGASYLRIAAWMYTPCAVSSMLFACCRGIEQMKISFAVNAVSYPINLILDYCMIFGKFGFPELGIRGSAVGAVIARLIEFGILLWFIIRKEKTLQMRLKDFLRKDWKLTKDFLKVGIPIVAHEMIWSAGTTAGSSITGQMSTTIVAGYNVANAMYQLMACTMNGILHACSVTIGKTIGSGASREEIQREAYRFIAIFAAIWPFSGMEMTGMIAVLRAGGDGKTGFISDIFTMWIFTIPLAAAGAFMWDFSPYVIIGIIKFNIVLEALVGIWRIRSMKWIRNLTAA